jgi:hypothetical protein
MEGNTDVDEVYSSVHLWEEILGLRCGGVHYTGYSLFLPLVELQGCPKA